MIVFFAFISFGLRCAGSFRVVMFIKYKCCDSLWFLHCYTSFVIVIFVLQTLLHTIPFMCWKHKK